jgi:hypothetical protein
MVVQIKIPFVRISQPKWVLSLKWIFISCFKPILVLKLSSKGLSFSRAVLSVQTKPDCLVFVGSYTQTYLTLLTPSLFFHSPLLKNYCEGGSRPLGGHSLVPSWNLGLLGWNQLPKNRCL